MLNLTTRTGFGCTASWFLLLTPAWGDDAVEADRRGIGAGCASDADCFGEGQDCLTEFSGGYCGSSGCTNDSDCPEGAACVRHDDDVQYCFRLCGDKTECNENRTLENESNCVSSVSFVDADRTSGKACVPPSGS